MMQECKLAVILLILLQVCVNIAGFEVFKVI